MSTSFCDLPQDCLGLVFSKLDFGRERQLVWALSGSCKTVQQAVKKCPANVKLYGRWHRRQLLGLMAVLPSMASLSMCNEGSEISDHSHSSGAAAEEVRQIGKWLGQSKLKSLSLNNRQMEPAIALPYKRWDVSEDVPCLPNGLQHLELPRGILSYSVVEKVNSLGGLTCLECCSTGFWPTQSLNGLKELAICTLNLHHMRSGDVRDVYMATEGFRSSLKQLTILTRLRLHIIYYFPALELPPSIQNLELKVLCVKSPPLEPLLTALPLTCLQLDRDGHSKSYLDLSGGTFNQLRDLSVIGYEPEFPKIGAPHLTALKLLACGTDVAHVAPSRALFARDILRVSTLTAIRYLEISNWFAGDDLRPLSSLPLLTHLKTSQELQLLEGMMLPGCLRNLERVTVWIWDEHFWMVRQSKEHWPRSALATITNGLLALPRFRWLAFDTMYVPCVCSVQDLQAYLMELGVCQQEKWRCVYRGGQEGVFEKV